MPFFFPKKHRNHRLVLWLMAGEFPLTIVMLTLTGIASHNLYQTFLWQDGADNGFNSAPNEALYAAANYREFKPPMVWSGLYVIALYTHKLMADPSSITSYNLVLGVLSTFFLITKLPIHWMQLFYPPIAVGIHTSLFILYIVSAAYQAGSDESDPKHPQPGPPWYIAKSCSVAYRKSNVGYCMQAKSLFAVTIILLIHYTVILGFNIHSCFITKEERDKVLEAREDKKTTKEFEDEIFNSPMYPMTPGTGFPRTPGFPPMVAQPFAPRTPAFNRIDQGSPSNDLPLRDNRAPYDQYSPQNDPSPQSTKALIHFPPPPKKANN